MKTKKGERKMDEKKTAASEGCTHNCSSCSPESCGPDCSSSKKPGLSFFGTLGAISDHTDKMDDDELMKLLQDAVDEWEES